MDFVRAKACAARERQLLGSFGVCGCAVAECAATRANETLSNDLQSLATRLRRVGALLHTPKAPPSAFFGRYTSSDCGHAVCFLEPRALEAGEESHDLARPAWVACAADHAPASRRTIMRNDRTRILATRSSRPRPRRSAQATCGAASGWAGCSSFTTVTPNYSWAEFSHTTRLSVHVPAKGSF